MKQNYRQSLFLALLAAVFCVSQASAQVFWTEDFGTACSQNNIAQGTITANGTWTVDYTVGTNAPLSNDFFISATEAGMGAGNCGDGCLANALLTSRSLHVGNEAGSPASGLWCPTGDCGAAYDASVDAAMRAESPIASCAGQTGISVSFDYMMFGEAGADEGSLWYWDGATWTAIANPLPQTTCCLAPCGNLGAQGQWTNVTYPLPGSADNNPNVKIGFQWINDANNSGADPSFAVDDVQLIATSSNPLPVADFSASNTTICENDCINFTDLSTGTPTSWNWTFPGAATPTSTAQNPTGICYPTAGTYDVTLSVTNANGTDDTTMTAMITVTACTLPVADFTVSNTTICENDCINFTDISTGNPTSWNWTFPGSSTPNSTAQNPAGICYPTAGTYDVTLSVTNANGTDDTTMTALITVTACAGPTASFTTANTSICENDCIDFTDLSTGSPTSWNWSFPGSSTPTSTAQNPTGICYPTAGTYDVTLSVTSANGTDDSTIVAYITVTACGPLPVPDFSTPNTSICVTDCIDFTDLTTNSPTSWNWSFPGGTPASSTVQNPTGICYNSPGVYDVTLTATNANGSNSTTMTGYITVTDCNQPNAGFSMSAPGVCEGECMNFTNTTVGATSFSWSFPGGNPSTSTDPNPSNICFDVAGTYVISMTATNAVGTDTYTDTVYVGVPNILDAGPTQYIFLGDSAILNAMGGAGDSCVWTPEQGIACVSCDSTVVYPTTSTIYTVTCTDSLGCVSTTTAHVFVDGTEAVGVPGAFSPNGDQTNDILYVEGTGVSQIRFIVYNRYGQKVFESIDIEEGWDGTFKGKRINPGVFVWYLEVEFLSGTIEKLKGNVTLIH